MNVLVIWVLAGIFAVLEASNLGQPPLFVEEPSPVIALKGSLVKLNCSTVGTPKPSTEWLKDGVRIQPDGRRVIQPSGALHIQPVQGRRSDGSDEGVYQCLASNAAGAIASRKVSLHIAALSRRFTAHPQSATVWEGTTARFACKTKKAVPPANISWERDGQPLKPSSRHVILPTGALQITNVQQSDEGSYRCVASNIAKTKRSNYGQLTVNQAQTRKQPYFSILPSNASVISGQQAVLECIATGVPVPSVQWKKVGDANKAYDATPVHAGYSNVQIPSVSAKDGGEYLCIVSALGKSITHSAFLFVKEPPHFVKTPKQPRGQSEVGNTIKMRCSARGTPAPRITWLKDGKLVTSNSRIMLIHSGINNDLTILKLSMKDAGVYQCFAENDIGSAQSSTRVIVRRSVANPIHVTGTAQSSSEVLVSWTPPLEPAILAYSISYQPADKSERELDLVEGPNRRSSVIRNLQGYTNYSFYVKPYFQDGGQGVKSKVVTVRTLSGQPTVAPGKVTLNSFTPDSIDVKWEAPPKRYQNGIIISYMIKYTSKSGQSPIPQTIRLPGSIQQKTISGLTSGEMYSVKVAAATEVGWGPFSHEEVLVVTTQQKDLISSPKITISAVNSTALEVSWLPPSYGADRVQEYRLFYGSKGTIHGRQHLGNNTNSFRISRLTPNTKYVVRLMAWDGKKSGQPAVEFGRTLLGGTQSSHSGIANVVCIPENPTSILVSWTKAFASRNPAYYTISYGVVGNLNKENDKTKHVVETSSLISKLLPGRKYRVKVRPFDTNNSAMSDWVDTNSPCTTPELAPGSPPRNLKFAIMSEVSVNLQWEPPIQPNGKVSHYSIAYTTNPKQPGEQWTHKKEVVSNLFSRFEHVVTIRLTGLTPNATFYIKVKAGNKQGYGPYTDTIKVLMVVPGKGKQDDAPVLTYQHISLTSVEISWPRPSSYKGKANGYVILYTTNELDSESNWQKRLFMVGLSHPFVRKMVIGLNGLSPNKTYYVKVRADYGNQYGPWSKVVKISMHKKDNPTANKSASESDGPVKPSPEPQAAEEKEDFEVKLGIIIGCIISAFCIVMLALFIIWRCPCRLNATKKQKALSLANGNAANGYMIPPHNSSHQTMSSTTATTTTGNSSSIYEESAGSSISNTCQCRCTCNAKRWPPVNSMATKPQNQVAGQLLMTQTLQEFRKASLQNHTNKDTVSNGHVQVPLEVLSDGKNGGITVARRTPNANSISVEV